MGQTKRRYVQHGVLCILLIAFMFILVKTVTVSHSEVSASIGAEDLLKREIQVQTNGDIPQTNHKSDTEINEITHEDVVDVTDKFMDLLVQDIDDNYKVLQYDDIDELLADFETIATKSVAEPYVDYYYDMQEDGLYIVPTETPPWFIADNPYDVVQLDNNTVQIIQTNTSDFYGTYTIEVELTYETDWKITKITHL